MNYIKSLLFLSFLLIGACAPKVGKETSSAGNPPSDFRAAAPKAGPARQVEIGKSNQFTLANGLKVIVVENHKLPPAR